MNRSAAGQGGGWCSGFREMAVLEGSLQLGVGDIVCAVQVAGRDQRRPAAANEDDVLGMIYRSGWAQRGGRQDRVGLQQRQQP